MIAFLFLLFAAVAVIFPTLGTFLLLLWLAANWDNTGD